ncbi:MAG: ribbon-helix-helix domain-containing protein [Alphaproteobacteria bacterium]|nr:ribbon-helix-helix domain-containing protein [Alphaproteobacteria bacterium]
MIILMSKVVSIHERKTCMRLTDVEWRILDRICYREKIKRKYLLELIEDNSMKGLGLTPSVRLFSLLYVYNKLNKLTTNQTCLKNILSQLK